MAKSLVKRERWSFRDFQKAVQVLKEDWERVMRTLFCPCPVPSCCRLKRNTGWWENVWNTYSDARFKKTNRVSQKTFSFILNCIAPLLVQQTVTEEPITSALKLAICLYRLGRGDYLYTISEISGLGVFTVSSICLGVCQVLVDHLWNETVSTHMLLDMEEFWQFPCCWTAIAGYCYDMQKKTFRTSTFAFSFLCNSQLLCNFLDWLCNHFGLLTCQFSGYTTKHFHNKRVAIALLLFR